MPTLVWILLWAAFVATVAFLAFREIRIGRKPPAEFDRTQHQAVRESMGYLGPNGIEQTYFGS